MPSMLPLIACDCAAGRQRRPSHEPARHHAARTIARFMTCASWSARSSAAVRTVHFCADPRRNGAAAGLDKTRIVEYEVAVTLCPRSAPSTPAAKTVRASPRVAWRGRGWKFYAALAVVVPFADLSSVIGVLLRQVLADDRRAACTANSSAPIRASSRGRSSFGAASVSRRRR